MRFFNRRSRQGGAELVEFILPLPIVLLLFFGIVELAVGFFDQAILAHASRVAAREAIRSTPPPGVEWSSWQSEPALGIEEAAKAAAERMYRWKTAGELSVEVDPNDPLIQDEGTPISVTLTYPYQFFVLPNFGLDLNLTLTARTEMRVLPRVPPP